MRVFHAIVGLTTAVLLLAGIGLSSWQDARAEDDPAAVKRAQAELDACIHRHVNALVTLAKHWRKKDPAVAIRALKRAFVLQPGCAAAGKVAKQMDLPDLERTEFLFDGTNLNAWRSAELPQWRMDGGCLRGDAPDATYIAVTLDPIEGDYTVRMEARVVKEYSTGGPYFAIGGDASDSHHRVEFGYYDGLLVLMRSVGKGEKPKTLHKRRPTDMRPAFKPTAWACYELRFRHDTVCAYLNGRHIADVDREGQTGGHITMVVQRIAFLVRRVEVVRH